MAERYDTAAQDVGHVGYASAGTTAGEYRYTVKPYRRSAHLDSG